MMEGGKKRLYISLPITGYDLAAQRQTANEMKIIFGGVYDVVTPFDICPEEGKEYAYYMGRDIEELLKCDAAYFCAGFHLSKGCMAEFEICRIYGIEILA